LLGDGKLSLGKHTRNQECHSPACPLSPPGALAIAREFMPGVRVCDGNSCTLVQPSYGMVSPIDAVASSEVHMRTARLLGGAAFVAWTLTAATVAGAQELGDAREGLRFAQKACAECHAVLRRQALSPMPSAPTFKAVANTPGMTGRALTVWFRSSHPMLPKKMPNLVIDDDDLDNVIAYILSLRDRK
jgi:mono/diheme cytochrome c family protein